MCEVKPPSIHAPTGDGLAGFHHAPDLFGGNHHKLYLYAIWQAISESKGIALGRLACGRGKHVLELGKLLLQLFGSGLRQLVYIVGGSEIDHRHFHLLQPGSDFVIPHRLTHVDRRRSANERFLDHQQVAQRPVDHIRNVHARHIKTGHDQSLMLILERFIGDKNALLACFGNQEHEKFGMLFDLLIG